MKLSAFALAAVLLAGVAAPALASSDDPMFDGSFLTTALQQKGVNAVAVYENSDNIVRAVIQQADGSETFAYFYQDTLQPVKSGADAAQTRVLSKVDNGIRHQPVGDQYPNADTFFD
jgi:hypothetical protein